MHIGIKDIIDILVVGSLMYYLYCRTKSSGTIRVFQGLIIFLLGWILVSHVFNLRLLGSIMNMAVDVLAIAVLVIFQNEIRQGLIRMGSRHRWDQVLRFFGKAERHSNSEHLWIDELVRACTKMAEQKVGALIVIEREDMLDSIAQTGCEVDAVCTTRMIEQIFYKNTPLHDGAVIMRNGRILAAACILPVSHSKSLPLDMGLRHRSAMGVSEISDAKVIVVSEETGHITVIRQGHLLRHLGGAQLQKILLQN